MIGTYRVWGQSVDSKKMQARKILAVETWTEMPAIAELEIWTLCGDSLERVPTSLAIAFSAFCQKPGPLGKHTNHHSPVSALH